MKDSNNDNKYKYFWSLVKVTKTITADGLITLTGLTREGRGVEVQYQEGCTSKDVSVKTIKRNGVRQELTPNGNTDRYSFNRNNSSVQAGELILQLDRMSSGLDPLKGEYNHLFPISYQKEERFSIMNGEICSYEQNLIHWNVCEKVRKNTGYLIEVSAYSPAIGVLAVAPTISKSFVESLQNSGLIKIRGRELK